MDEKDTKMNAKRTLVSFLLIASVLFLAATVSAAGTTSEVVKVDGISVVDSPALITGDTISVKVKFTASVDASDVRVKATLEGNKDDVTDVTHYFDVVDGNTYTQILTLKVPSDIDKDEISDKFTLTIKVWNSDDDVTYEDEWDLTVQRPSYDFAIKSVNVDNSIDAGQSVPVEVVLKNVGYNNADDVYVTVSIPELNIEKSAYLGDLVTKNYKDTLSTDDDDTDTVSGRLYLEVPYTAKSGVYTLVVTAENDETTSTAEKQVAIENSVSDIAMKSGNDLVLINPTNQLKVYRVVYGSNDVTVVIQAGSSKTITIETAEDTDVMVYSGETLLSTVKFSGSAQTTEDQLTNPVFVLTVILAIVFLVLLVVLVVLITKKPQKTEEFGESYY